MNHLKTTVLFSVLLAFVAMAAIGCEKEGPAEKAAKKMDEAFDSAKKTFKKLTDD